MNEKARQSLNDMMEYYNRLYSDYDITECVPEHVPDAAKEFIQGDFTEREALIIYSVMDFNLMAVLSGEIPEDRLNEDQRAWVNLFEERFCDYIDWYEDGAEASAKPQIVPLSSEYIEAWLSGLPIPD